MKRGRAFLSFLMFFEAIVKDLDQLLADLEIAAELVEEFEKRSGTVGGMESFADHIINSHAPVLFQENIVEEFTVV
jgi:hypothetical protein